MRDIAMLNRNRCLTEVSPGVFYCKNRHIYHHNPPPNLICCPERMLSQDTFVTYADMVQHTMEIYKDVADMGITGVIGIARSGVIPASIISMQLHVPLYLLDIKQQTITEAGSGFRLHPESRQETFLLIDDSYASGLTLRRALPIIAKHDLTAGKKVITAVVYASELSSGAPIDVIGYQYPLPHFLEWNFFNSTLMEGVGVDFDGILCYDIPDIEAASPAEYEARLISAVPLYLPLKMEIEVICSGRLKRWEQQSIEWLKRHGVRFKHIEFLDLDDPHRRTGEKIISHKCRIILQYGLRTFVESDPRQAEAIAVLTGVPVVCPAARKVYGLQQSNSGLGRLARQAQQPHLGIQTQDKR